ncbi:MAG: glycine cleavage system protein H [Syntrophobacteraceae bacterium]
MGEFLETTYDKFVFKVKTGCFYSQDDFWAEVNGNTAVIGVSDFLQKAKGDVAFLETAEVGAEVKQGEEIGKIETIKATFGIASPVSGKIVEVNPELEASPFLINEDCYGKGWIYKLELSNFGNDKASLLDADKYLDLMKGKIAEEMKTK